MTVEIQDYFSSRGWEYKQENTWFRLKICPYCYGGSNGKDLWSFALNSITGAGKCHRASCNWTGGLSVLKKDMGDLAHPIEKNRKAKALVKPLPNFMFEHETLLKSPELLSKLMIERTLTEASIRRFNLGTHNDYAGNQFWSFLYRNSDGTPAYVKYKGEIDGTRQVRRCPSGVPSVLYGCDRLEGFLQAIIVEGEEDALVLTQAGLLNVVSVPDGATISTDKMGQNSWLNPLERFREIVLCLDNDAAGKKAEEALAKLLGEERCKLVQHPLDHKDACDYARAEALPALISAISTAKAPNHPLVVHASDRGLSDQMKKAWSNPDPHGISTGWAGLDSLLGGWRPGELSVITGHTGSGKSAFTVNAAVQVALAGHATMLCSLELSLEDQVWRLLQRISGLYPWARPDKSWAGSMDEANLDKALEKLSELPIHLVRRFGNITAKEFKDCVTFTTRRFDTRLHLFDHLHFATIGSNDAERHALTNMMYEFKTAARDLQTHILVVAHPSRFARGKDEPDLTDLHGAASIEQIADNVITVRRIEHPSRSLAQFAVKKLRQGRSGKLGRCDMEFNPAGEQFFDPQPRQEETEEWSD